VTSASTTVGAARGPVTLALTLGLAVALYAGVESR